MSIYRPLFVLAPLALMLTACASDPKTEALQSEVQELTQKVQKLSTEAEYLERQKAMNENNEQSIYLIPAANSDAVGVTSIGQLRLLISHLEPEADGSKAVLQIKTANGSILPSFTGTLEWGSLNQATLEPDQSSTLSQSISFKNPATPTNVTSMEVRLSDIAPENLGFIRLSGIERQ
ncbi:DUF3251 domain-containing protein [Hafnia alvei]|uniref:DUF3251 domain-containing protein n=1 Tax=Hafnia alvei ATCC 51873 TaxID=1002364 RepID=G9YDB5_HAFAL|nr:DUF3251 domain-containing protein [Hafnia alvei]EHM37879.1 hypothetical protein HMPREF0454_04613 [Hafnia alvei ATCC 51873]QQE43936.1 DUF3251 domain-containing protein [Hafnia alvei]